MAMNPRLLRPTASTGFTPANIAGLGAWFDATDRSTLSQTSDGATAVTANDDPVAYWKCKITGTALTQAIDANRPLWKSAGINSKPALDFDGSNDILFATSGSLVSVLRNVSGATVVAVRLFTVAGGVFRIAANISIGGGGTVFRLGFSHNTSANSGSVGGRRLDADAFAQATYTNTDNSPGILAVTGDYANTALIARLNGSQVGQNASWLTAGSTSDTDSSYVSIGGTLTSLPSTAGSFFNGQFSEFLVWPRVLTATELAAVERHLSNKYGIALA